MDKVTVVSGGTKGIGKAIVRRFASEGFSVITCSRNREDLNSLEKEIRSEFGTEIFCMQADLSQKEEVSNFVKFIMSTGLDPEILVNNSGVFVPGQIHSEKEGVLESQISINLYSAYHLTRGLIHGMIRKRRGHIFNICSTASITAYVNGGAYCISKYALYGMTKVLREEMKEHNIRVTAVLPGATLTASWEGVNLPPERFIRPEDVAELIYSAWHISPSAVVEDLLVRPQLGDIG
jgi:short-subunit dehydrogenase